LGNRAKSIRPRNRDFRAEKDEVWLSETRLVSTPAGNAILAENFNQGEFGVFVPMPANPRHHI